MRPGGTTPCGGHENRVCPKSLPTGPRLTVTMASFGRISQLVHDQSRV